MREKTGIPREVSTADLGVLLGMSVQGVNALATKGVLTRTGRGRFETTPAVRAYVKYKEGLAAARNGSGDYAANRARLTGEKARLAEMDRMQRERALIPREDVVAHWVAIASMIKSALLAMPRRLANQVYRTKTAEEAEALLRREARQILTRFAAADAMPPRHRKLNGEPREPTELAQ
jgi:phage terminase Nu1 subunit (DNA packaging protein)